jgi:methionyl-tRNA synthetase
MGKDNITFHTVIFPSTLLASKLNWTKLHHVSSTEYLNYEMDEKTGKPKKFSKTRGTGVFGDDAKKTGIPSEVWRYYLLINRPEHSDITFLWSDFVAKNNNELLANLGNFSNRCLKFLDSAFEGKVPEYTSKILNEYDQKFVDDLNSKFSEYVEIMEQVKMKEALKIAMAYSSQCNEYFQHTKPWELNKNNKERCAQVMNIALNALFFLCKLLEPFMPSFSAKVYEQMNIRPTDRDEKIFEFVKDHPERIISLLTPGHKIGTPAPIFREISTEEMEKWKAQFSGRE